MSRSFTGKRDSLSNILLGIGPLPEESYRGYTVVFVLDHNSPGLDSYWQYLAVETDCIDFLLQDAKDREEFCISVKVLAEKKKVYVLHNFKLEGGPHVRAKNPDGTVVVELW